MNFIFYITALIGVISSIKVIVSRDAINGLLYLTLLLLSLASICISFHHSLSFAFLFLLYAVIIAASQYCLIKKGLKQTLFDQRISPRIWLTPAIVCYFFIFLLTYLLLTTQEDGSLSPLFAVEYNKISISGIIFLSILFCIFIIESLLILFFLHRHKKFVMQNSIPKKGTCNDPSLS